MNIVMWVLAGSLLGWIGYTYAGFNAGRGMMVSAVIGAFGGIVGGKLIAPVFAAATALPGDFSISALFCAAGAAAAFLFAGNLIHDRFGV